MTDKPLEDEPGAQERFDRGIANALKTPPKPHKPKTPPGEPGSGRVSVQVRKKREND